MRASLAVIALVAGLALWDGSRGHAGPQPQPGPPTSSLPKAGGSMTGHQLWDVNATTLTTWPCGLNQCAGQTLPPTLTSPCASPPWPVEPGTHGNVPLWGFQDSSRLETNLSGQCADAATCPKKLFWLNWNATTQTVELNGTSDNDAAIWTAAGHDIHFGPQASGCCEGGDSYFHGGGGNDDSQGGIVGGKYGGRFVGHGGHGGRGQGGGSADLEAGNPNDVTGAWHPIDVAGAGCEITGTVNVGAFGGSHAVVIGHPSATNLTQIRSKSSTFNLNVAGAFLVNDGVDRLRVNPTDVYFAVGANTIDLSSTGTSINNLLTASTGVSTPSVQSNSGVALIKGATTYIDTGVANDGFVTLGANISIYSPPGTSGISMGNGTGTTVLPTGSISYVGASTKAVSITTAADGSLLIGGGNGSGATKIQDAAGNGYASFDESTGARLAYTDTTLTLNASTAGFSKTATSPLFSGSELQMTSTAADGTCTVSDRGKMRVLQGAGGATDRLKVCLKSAADTYSWVVVVTGG